MIESNVWERTGDDSISRGTFYLVIGGVLTWGLFLTSLVAGQTAAWQPSTLTLLLVGLVIPIIGILISSFSDNWLISLGGFHLVVVPFGAMLGPVVAGYAETNPGLVSEAARMTALVTFVMGASGFMYPNFYRSIGGFLFVALFGLLVVMILGVFIPALQGDWVSYIAMGIFALYIGYDMHRASVMPATTDNAVDTCVALYLDIINFFLHYLAARD